MDRKYYEEFKCEFNLENYPFDTQVVLFCLLCTGDNMSMNIYLGLFFGFYIIYGSRKKPPA